MYILGKDSEDIMALDASASTAVGERPKFSAEEEKYIIRNSKGIPVGTKPHAHWTWWRVLLWAAVAILGGIGWTMLAFVRGEQVNTIWFVVVSACTYAIAYRFYSLYIAKKIMRPDDRRATPAERINNGKDFDPTHRVVLFGHHFAAIAGAGPLVGPVLAAQMGYLPSTLWIVFGVVLAGAVQDMLVLFFSMRRGGRSLGQMARDEIGKIGGTIAMVIVLVMLMIVLAVLAMVCVNALAASPWGVFAVGVTIPIAVIMGLWLRYVQPGKVTLVSTVGFIVLVICIICGRWVAASPFGAYLHLSPTALTWAVMIYGFIASILPVWVLLAPRDYLSTFMKIGTIALLALGIVVVRPLVQTPAATSFAFNTSGPVFAGQLFPFLFITVACGALSGMHAMVSSGTTPKMIQKESQARMLGYGGMLMESFVAIMALAAAVSLNQGVYFAMNTSSATLKAGASSSVTSNKNANLNDIAASAIRNLHVTDAAGKPIRVIWQSTDSSGKKVTYYDGAALQKVAQDVGEVSVTSRTGGAPTLAVGMANIIKDFGGGTGMMGFWYHFAVLFEALFILSSVDAVTRTSRFQLSDALGNWFPRFRDPSWRPGTLLTTGIVVAAWGSLLLMGVNDPRGGIQTLYPLFGIANQLIAAVALMIVTVMVIRKGYLKWVWIPLLPLAFDVATTFTASWQKIFSTDPAIGYWEQWSRACAKLPTLTGSAAADEQAIIRNTFIQGSLSVLFLVCCATVLVYSTIAAVKSIRAKSTVTSEDPVVESSLYAPTSLIATSLERKVQREFEAIGPKELISTYRR